MWLSVLLMLLVTVVVVTRDRGPSVRIDGAWVLDRVQTRSVDQTLHGPSDFRPSLGIGRTRAYVDQGCGGFEFDLENTSDRLQFELRQQDRSYGPCQGTDSTPGRWDSWLSRVDHAARRGSTLVLSGTGVRLVWHRAPGPPPPDPGAVSLDGAWLLETLVVAGRTVDLNPFHPAVLGVDSFGDTVDTGCTQQYGELEISSYHHWARVVLAHAAHRPCRSGLRPQEQAVLRGLRAARQFNATATTLELTGRSTALVFRRLPQPQIERLDGTHWRLTGLADGSVTTPPRRFRAAPTHPRVLFSVIDGFTNLNRGCRATAGGFGIDGAGRIQALERREKCHFSTPLDRYLTAIYSHPWWFRIVGDTLRVQASSGRGLIYRRVGQPSHPSG